jgi:hypothetical protein
MKLTYSVKRKSKLLGMSDIVIISEGDEEVLRINQNHIVEFYAEKRNSLHISTIKHEHTFPMKDEKTVKAAIKLIEEGF